MRSRDFIEATTNALSSSMLARNDLLDVGEPLAAAVMFPSPESLFSARAALVKSRDQLNDAISALTRAVEAL